MEAVKWPVMGRTDFERLRHKVHGLVLICKNCFCIHSNYVFVQRFVILVRIWSRFREASAKVDARLTATLILALFLWDFALVTALLDGYLGVFCHVLRADTT